VEFESSDNVSLMFSKLSSKNVVEYEGIEFKDDCFEKFLKETVSPSFRDSEYNIKMKTIAIDMTGFESNNLNEVFETMPKISEFRIGEIVAEKIVESRYTARFSYNSDRDLKNKNSNNTGADLVGFIELEDGAVKFLFGEVKTSSDKTTPPGVMYSNEGMIEQLKALGKDRDKIPSLVKWLFCKCIGCEDVQVKNDIKQAMTNYCKDKNDIRLIGVLVRDTTPNERDLKSRYTYLNKELTGKMPVQLLAVYSKYEMKNNAWKDLI